MNETTVADFEVKRGPGRPRKSTTLTMVDSDSVSNDLDDHNKKEQMPLEVNDSVVVKRGKVSFQFKFHSYFQVFSEII